MSRVLKINLVDDNLKEIKQFIIQKPKLFEEVKFFIEQNISKNTIILNSLGKDKYELKSQKDYEKASLNNVLYARKIESGKENLAESIFTRNLNKLSESKQDIITEKYSCSICLELIKDENPLLCYVCQKIFHHKCLKNWEKQQKEKHLKLSCPNCRNELALNKWKEKLDFEEMREKDADIMSQMNSGSLSPNQYIIKSNELFEKILLDLNEIYSLIHSNENQKLNDLINRIKNNITTPSIDDITIEILDQLKLIKNYIKAIPVNKNNNEGNKNNSDLEYFTEEEGIYDIFGEKFVKNNKNNIELIINGKPNKLVDKYVLLKGKNVIKMIIKNDLKNIEEMFNGCKTLVNINPLKDLDIKYITSMSGIFNGCESLKDIKPLENWNVSKIEDLSYLFYSCKSLTDINPLKNWDVSICKKFKRMFSECNFLSDISALKNWNVSNGDNFSGMFYECYYLEDLTPLNNWNVSNCYDFGHMFGRLKILTDLTPLKNWNVAKSENFKCTFYECKKLSDLKPLQNWDVSLCEDFSYMFEGCASLSDISPLFNWNFKDSHVDCKEMFSYCSSNMDKNSLKKLKFKDKACFDNLIKN